MAICTDECLLLDRRTPRPESTLSRVPENEEFIRQRSTVIETMQWSVLTSKAPLASCQRCGGSVQIIQHRDGLPFYKCDQCSPSSDTRPRDSVAAPVSACRPTNGGFHWQSRVNSCLAVLAALFTMSKEVRVDRRPLRPQKNVR